MNPYNLRLQAGVIREALKDGSGPKIEVKKSWLEVVAGQLSDAAAEIEMLEDELEDQDA